ncbi:MAG: serine/threonine-protein kinase [Planctomycetes bacterium]|nr:serine/threonine-protein kinase [Planctomycetota bacterium]
MDDRRILEHFPLPIARGYRRVRNAGEVRERHDAAYYLFEVYLKYAAAVAIAHYLAGEARDHRLNAVLKGLARPSIGEWVRFLRETLRCLARDSDNDPAIQALGALYEEKGTRWPGVLALYNALRCFRSGSSSERSSASLAQLLEELVSYRNRVLGHGAPLDRAHYERFGELLPKAVVELLEASPFLAARRLVAFDSVQVEAGSRIECSVIEFMSDRPIRRDRPLVIDYGSRTPEKNVLHLLDEGGRFLKLDPLLVAHREDVYFLNEADGALEYLSYSTGERYRAPGLGESQRRLLGSILGYEVDEAQLTRIGDDLAAQPGAPEARSPDTAERRLGDFRIVRELGRGAMGVVLEGFQESLGRRVALKVLPGSFALDPRRVERFHREARAAARLHHPNIVPVYEVGEAEGSHFYAMELIDGPSLEQSLAQAREESARRRPKRGSSTASDPGYIAQTVDQFAGLADGLEQAHRQGLVHRDVKPSNILVGSGGRLILIDFGLVHEEEARTLTRSGEMLGTLAYMSPEQVSRGRVEARSDIFSLAVTLYEALTLKNPFERENEHEIQKAILFEDPVPPRKLNWRMNRDLETILLRALEKHPDRRYASAAELAADLRRFLRHEPIQARPRSALSRWGRRFWRQRYPWAAALAVLAAAVLGIVVLSRQSGERTTVADFERVTADLGLSTDPSLSSDGALLVYASDRASGKDLDLWSQPLAGGESRRLTSDPLDEHEPVLSPDGARLAFRWEKDGGGLYVRSLARGEQDAILLAALGRRPRFSPDGRWIAFWTGTVQHDSILHGEIHIVPAAGGPTRRLQQDFFAARYPAWSPSGEHILFVGAKAAPASEAYDFFVTSIEGGAPVATEAYMAMSPGSKHLASSQPGTWTARGNRLFFTSYTVGPSNLWSVQIHPTSGKVLGAPELVRSGTSAELQPWMAENGSLVFSSQEQKVDVWSLAIDPETGEASGEPVPVTRTAAVERTPTISRNGKRVSFSADEGKTSRVCVLDLDRPDVPVYRTSGPGAEFYPSLSDDGAYVALRRRVPDGPRQEGRIVRLADGAEVLQLTDHGHSWGWSPDGKTLLYWPGGAWPRASIAALEVSSGATRQAVQSDRYALYHGHLSPRGPWLCFNAVAEGELSKVFVAPYHEDRITPEEEWIHVAGGSALADKPRWSHDGRIVYFVSDHDGFRCLYGQRLHPETRKPEEGALFDLRHFHEARRSLANISIGDFEPWVARDRIVYNLAEITGSIWRARVERN